MAFSETVKAMLAGREVRVAILLHLEFKTQPKRIHIGYGKIRAGGFIWEGIGEAVSMEGLERAMGGTAPQAAFTLSGVSTSLLAATLAASDEVNDRPITVFLQFFGADNKPLDTPYATYRGMMDVMSFKRTGPALATVTLTSETLFVHRSRPIWGALSDRDQKRLYPGDRGLERIAQIPSRTVPWPIIVG